MGERNTRRVSRCCVEDAQLSGMFSGTFTTTSAGVLEKVLHVKLTCTDKDEV